jgi:hypothetical protein
MVMGETKNNVCRHSNISRVPKVNQRMRVSAITTSLHARPCQVTKRYRIGGDQGRLAEIVRSLF